MKRQLIKGSLLLAVFLSVFTVSQVAIAYAQSSDFLLGDIKVSQEYETNDQQDTGEVFAESTENHEVPTEEVAEPIPVIVEVASGDSLGKIAAAHNTTYKRLFDANGFIADPNIINPGDKVRIPFADEVLAERALPTPKPVAKPAATPVAQPKATAPSTAPAVASGSVWDRLAACESGGRWNINTGNGYYGGLQFSAATWRGVGGSGLPHQHSREEQIKRAEILLARSGWGQWPACSKKLGLR